LVGGALKDGSVDRRLAGPQLREANLFENRDFEPTIDLRAALKGVFRNHLRTPERAQTTFADSADACPLEARRGTGEATCSGRLQSR
jgi:uncharacterized protein (DUF1501 family)